MNRFSPRIFMSAYLKENHFNTSVWQSRVHQYGLKEASRMQDEDDSVDLDWLEIDPEDGRTNTLAPAHRS